jgi:tritrans,polycis-undecaprenyl-diphosphate synthase [geranylgeranyl-diphosphate specific]
MRSSIKIVNNSINHIGFIMDGNRRFAKRLMLEPWKGHEIGKEKLKEVLSWLSELEIHEATFYAFSRQNFNRPKKEFDYLMRIFLAMSTDFLNDPKINDNDIRIRFVGETHLFPKNVQKVIQEVTDKTAENTNYIINIALGYGGRDEIINAVKNIANQVKQEKLSIDEINEETITSNLKIQSEPDLIIRTGGDHRTSNFLPWQSIYSEWAFVDKMWPEFNKEDFIECVNAFNARERRFGK